MKSFFILMTLTIFSSAYAVENEFEKAIASKDHKKLSELLAAGKLPTVDDLGKAIRERNNTAVQLMVDSPMDLDKEIQKEDLTPLKLSIKYQNQEAFMSLLRGGAEFENEFEAAEKTPSGHARNVEDPFFIGVLDQLVDAKLFLDPIARKKCMTSGLNEVEKIYYLFMSENKANTQRCYHQELFRLAFEQGDYLPNPVSDYERGFHDGYSKGQEMPRSQDQIQSRANRQ